MVLAIEPVMLFPPVMLTTFVRVQVVRAFDRYCIRHVKFPPQQIPLNYRKQTNVLKEIYIHNFN